VRLGAVWDEVTAACEEDGEKTAVFIERALRAELRRRARKQGKPAE
jgi:hypothetical protein